MLMGLAGGIASVHAAETIPAATASVPPPDPMTLMDANSTALFNLINSARENPKAVAESFGVDVYALLQQLPDLQPVFNYGLPPLNADKNICQAAQSHVADMVAKRYYDYTSPDGATVMDRITAAGYDAAVADESLGMLGFTNYMAPDVAIERIFKSMFLAELAPENAGNRKILNSVFIDVGVAMEAAKFQIGPSRMNVYLAVCDFVAGPIWILENQFLALINQARANPLKMAESLGMDPEKILRENPEIIDLLKNGVPPVAFNRYVYASASAHAKDMIVNSYFSKVSPDEKTVIDRIAATGYQAISADEIIGSTSYSQEFSIGQLAFQIFSARFKSELENVHRHSLVFLNPEYTDGVVVISNSAVKPASTGGDLGKYILIVFDFAKPVPVVSG